MTTARGGTDAHGAVSAAGLHGHTAASVLAEPVCGMTWGWTGVRGSWTTPEARASLAALPEYGVTWTALAYAAVQDTAQSTEIPFDRAPTVTDDEIRDAIRAAKALGQKVCLKPVVNCADGTWRAYIGFFDWEVPGEPNWTDWFASYTAFILHAALIAEEEACELFCIGCEMVRADGQEQRWRALIERVRSVYSGPITYNCDKYQEDHIEWWDAVDVIGSSGYYPIGTFPQELDRIDIVGHFPVLPGLPNHRQVVVVDRKRVDREPAPLLDLAEGAQIDHRAQSQCRQPGQVGPVDPVDAVGSIQHLPAGGATVGGAIAAQVPHVEERLEGDMASRWIQFDGHRLRMPDQGDLLTSLT